MANTKGSYTNVRVTTVEFDFEDTVIEVPLPKNSIVLAGGGINVEEAFTAGSMQLTDKDASNIGSAVSLTTVKLNAVTGIVAATAVTVEGQKVVMTITGADAATAGKGTLAIVYAHLDETVGAYFGTEG